MIEKSMFYINVYTKIDAEEFCKWLLEMKPPISICVNGGKIFNFPDEVSKLFWLSGFQALIENKA